MFKLLVNAPSGKQEIVTVEKSGGYFDSSRVIWDEREDGAFPSDMLENIGGILRSGKKLAVDSTLLAASKAAAQAAQSAEEAKSQRLARARQRIAAVTEDGVITAAEMQQLIKALAIILQG